MVEALREYELGVILNPEINDDSVPQSLERLQQAIAARGGEIVDTNHWGRRRLAYPISRHFEGNYVFTQIRMAPNEVPELESTLRISDEVIRHMIIRSDE